MVVVLGQLLEDAQEIDQREELALRIAQRGAVPVQPAVPEVLLHQRLLLALRDKQPAYRHHARTRQRKI